MINVGIIGCGFVGGALKTWLEENNKECALFVSDPAKGYHDDLSKVDIAFVQIHVPTEDDGTQDLTLMKELIRKLPDVQKPYAQEGWMPLLAKVWDGSEGRVGDNLGSRHSSRS